MIIVKSAKRELKFVVVEEILHMHTHKKERDFFIIIKKKRVGYFINFKEYKKKS